MSNGRITDPTDRDSFKRYIRAKLGEPQQELNVTDFQCDIAVDEALQYFQNYHYLGTQHVYYVHTLTQDDITSRSIPVHKDMVGITTIYDPSSAAGLGLSTSIYSGAWMVNYDLIFNQGTLSGTFLNYYMNKSYYDMVNQLLVGMKNLRFNQYENVVYLDNTWSGYAVGTNLILDGFKILNPDDNPEVWADRWLVRYATAKLKRQYGENISKYDVTLPGGAKLNYERIIREADEEIAKIEENCLRDYSEPPRDFIG